MIYNTPPSGLLDLEQIQQLATLPNVTAVKDSSGDQELMGDLLAWAASADFAVYVGQDSFLYDAVGAGARGAIVGMADFAPADFVELLATLQILLDGLHWAVWQRGTGRRPAATGSGLGS